MVKRYGNLWERVCSVENITKAYLESRKGKSHKPGVMEVDADPMTYIMEVKRLLETKEYRSGDYREIIVHDPKERIVYDVDYFPHRIVHWSLMLVIRPILMNCIGPHSYAAMKGRGSHQALTQLKEYLKDEEYSQYCFKMDVRKFFPSIDKDKMIEKLERKIKDPDVIWLCKEIVYGFPGTGLPIGNYTSQYFANYYLSDIDRFFKQTWHTKYLLRYMDDYIVLGANKSWLRRFKKRMEALLTENGLRLKDNWQIFPVKNGIAFVGYLTFRTHCLVRPRTRHNIKRACARIKKALKLDPTITPSMRGTIASYHGILKWCDGWTLANKTIFTIIPRSEFDGSKKIKRNGQAC